MNTRFDCQHFCLSVAWMWDNIKQEDSVDKNIKDHGKIRTLSSNKVDADHGLVCYLYLRNLEPGVAKFIRNKDCATIEDVYCKACNTNQKMKFTLKITIITTNVKNLAQLMRSPPPQIQITHITVKLKATPIKELV